MTTSSKTWRVSYQRPIEYEIINTSNIFHPQNLSLLSSGLVENARRFVVVDQVVAHNHLDDIRNYFAYHGIDAKIVTFQSGEENKTMEQYLSIVRALDNFPIHRRDEPIIAIGGGVLTDVIGFVASSYRRSVPHIKVPTTLMGFVDASLGIKTGLNYNGHKNRLGSFEPPLKVLLDKAFLRSQPRRHILNGVCEIIKLAVIKDAELFEMLELHGATSVDENFQGEISASILDRSIDGLLEELEPNLFEENLARKLDFGHTFSYGLETRHEAHLLHGEAVLLDIVISALIAHSRNLLSESEIQRIFQLVHRLGIQVYTDKLDPNLLWLSLEERVQHRNGMQRVPIPNGIGNCVFLNDIRLDEIQFAVQNLKEWMVLEYE